MQEPDAATLLDRCDMGGIALQDSARCVSYQDLSTSVRLLAGALRTCGVRPGDRVAVTLPNSAASVEVYLACLLVGAIWVGVNPSAPTAERDRLCALVMPRLTVVFDAGLPVASHSGATIEFGQLVATHTDLFDGTPPPPEAPCAIGFSSGTTGTPKAVVHSRRAVSLTASMLASVQLRADDRIGVVLPMSIHNLMVVGALPALFAGATCVAVERMDAHGVAAACTDGDLTRLTALVPATVHDLVHDVTVSGHALSSLRSAGTGAAGLSEELRQRFETKFGVRLIGSYGMTEAPGAVAIEHPSVPHVAGGSGRPLPHVRVDAVDADGRRVGPRSEGDLLISPVETGAWADCFRPPVGTWTADGIRYRPASETALRTGDRGWIDDDGTVHVTGRQADVLLRGGVNVNTAELEAVLEQLPDVRGVAVVGEPDARLGQRIIAFVEPVPGTQLNPAQCRRKAQDMLSHGKVPDEFVIRRLPRNAMGKVVRGRLSRAAPRHPDAQSG